jgi:hypothetical protein
MTYYYTIANEDQPVYHDHPDCEQGVRIEHVNRVDTDRVPSGRRRCGICLAQGAYTALPGQRPGTGTEGSARL